MILNCLQSEGRLVYYMLHLFSFWVRNVSRARQFENIWNFLIFLKIFQTADYTALLFLMSRVTNNKNKKNHALLSLRIISPLSIMNTKGKYSKVTIENIDQTHLRTLFDEIRLLNPCAGELRIAGIERSTCSTNFEWQYDHLRSCITDIWQHSWRKKS
jgi:hypothetical protein